MKIKPQNAKTAASVEAAIQLCKQPVMEPKYDGWRILVEITEAGPRIYSRTAKEYTDRVPEIVAELAKLPVGTIVDGEILAIAKDGDRYVNEWSATQNVLGASKNKATQAQRDKLTYIAFDVMADADEDVTKEPLEFRRARLSKLLTDNAVDRSRVTMTCQVQPTAAMYERLVDLGFEGAIVKDLNARYAQGKRGAGWFKLKAITTTDMVVMELPLNGKGQHEGRVGHMILGQMRDGKLVQRTQINPPDLAQRIEMSEHPERYLNRVVEMKAYGWSEDDCPRHPTFLRWREDKTPDQCDWNNG